MEQTMTSFITEMSNRHVDRLEWIVTHQYRKFINFYWLVRDIAHEIFNIEYKFDTLDSFDIFELDLELTPESDELAIKDKLESCVANNTSLCEERISCNGKKIHVYIKLNEEPNDGDMTS